MLSPLQLNEIKKRIEFDQSLRVDPQEGATNNKGIDLEDRLLLVTEVERLTRFVRNFSEQVNQKLDELEGDMVRLEKENERLRKVRKSANVERDACVGLIAQMATVLGIPAGIGKYEMIEPLENGESVTQLQNRVIVELPSGQVSWDYLDSEGHLFEALPHYAGSVENQTLQQNYIKVMNPGFQQTPRPGEENPLADPLLIAVPLHQSQSSIESFPQG